MTLTTPRASAEPHECTLLLHDEQGKTPHPEDLASRARLAEQLRRLPHAALTRLQYLQPQIGCFNRCAFCSQSAGRDVWQLTRRGLRNFTAALAAVGRERAPGPGPLVGTDRTAHRPGVVFPYLDNDIVSYPYLDEYVRLVWENLRARVRISTVGYSSWNVALQSMHLRIVDDLVHAIAGVRFSLTPYTFTWARGTHPTGERTQFVRDFANGLRTYRPLMESIGFGKETACVELRFAPLAVTFSHDVVDTFICDHHVISIGPHLLVRLQSGREPAPRTEIVRIDGTRPAYSRDPLPYLLITSDTAVGQGGWEEAARHVIASSVRTDLPHRRVSLYQFQNTDGPYYAADPFFLPDGSFRALHVYPRSLTRKVSGYLDTTRFLLNAILEHKATRGIGRRQRFAEATVADVAAVIAALHETVAHRADSDTRAAEHLRQEVLPLVEAYVSALLAAGYPPETFFHPRFTIDTGTIVNQGRARHLFRGLASREDDPITPHEERGYGPVSISMQRGYVWRIAPMPQSVHSGNPEPVAIGGKNEPHGEMAVQVQELDPRHLQPLDVATGQPLRTFVLTGIELEHVPLVAAHATLGYPGAISATARPFADNDDAGVTAV